MRGRLAQELFPGPDEASRPLRDASGCSEVVLSKPALSGRDGRLVLRARYSASVAAGAGGWCLGVTRRTGTLETEVAPGLHPSLPIVAFHVVDSKLSGADGTGRAAGALWDWVKPLAHPHLETFRIDLRQPVGEVAGLLPWLLADRDASRARRAIDSLALADATVDADALVVTVRVDVPEPAVPPPPAGPEAPWTAEQLARWEAAWQSWDAFLAFVVKRSARDGDEDLRRDLLAVLLDARHDLVAVLGDDAGPPGARDPVPALFLDTWERLAPVLRRLATRLPGEAALHYLSFVAAADAVTALEQLGPAYGIELSTDGLRRMARTLEPAPISDPTAYSQELDPELRALLGFGPPPDPSGEGETQRSPHETAPLGAATPRSGLDRLRSWRVLPVSGGATTKAPDLDRWVPSLRELPDYLTRVRDLLAAAALHVQRKKVFTGRPAEIYRNLVPATAWQESCWRQFVRHGGAVAPLTSSAGALGIMQVNPHVWRGFYEVAELRSSMRYNAMAGGEILHHYLVDYAIARREDEVRGHPDDLARAAYAAYNAGPSQLSRYRRDIRGAQGHPIDAAFFAKYERVRDGEELAVASCFPGSAGSA